MMTADMDKAEIIAKAKKFLTGFAESSAIDAKALELAHAPDKAKRIEEEADRLVAEIRASAVARSSSATP